MTDGTWTYTWQHGRQLASMTDGSTTWNYTYNADGLRTKKTNGTTTYEYIYNGSQLSQMTVGSNSLYFAYDASGIPMSVTYNGTTYYYVTNVQGDVIGILNASGALVVSYSYDAWGNPSEPTGSLASTLGVHNPLTYRSYVYDSETKLYYLQSRYYNPEVGRFLNADAFAATGQGLVGNNMFAYCNNSPIIFIDPEGSCIRTGYKPWLSVTLEYIDCKSVYCPTSISYIKSDFLRKSLETIDAIIYNTEIDAGIGLGMFISGSIYDVIGLDFGINYDLIHINYSQGEVRFMQTYFSGLEGTFLIMAKFDVHSDSGSRALPFSKDFGPWQEDTENNIWTIWGAGAYAALGGQWSVGVNAHSLADDLLRIFGRKK